MCFKFGHHSTSFMIYSTSKNTKTLSTWVLSRQRITLRPGHHCHVSTTTRRHPLWYRPSPKRPRSSATHRCVGWNANQTRGRGTGRAHSMLLMETVRYVFIKPSTCSLGKFNVSWIEWFHFSLGVYESKVQHFSFCTLLLSTKSTKELNLNLTASCFLISGGLEVISEWTRAASDEPPQHRVWHWLPVFPKQRYLKYNIYNRNTHRKYTISSSSDFHPLYNLYLLYILQPCFLWRITMKKL